MITQKKTVEEYVYEYTTAVLTNNPFPDKEYYWEASLGAATGDSSVGLRGQSIPKTGRLVTNRCLRMFVSPAFPNNVVLPDDLKGYADKASYHCYFGLYLREILNQFGIIVAREVLRRFVYVLPVKDDLSDVVFDNWQDWVNYDDSTPHDNKYAFPILFELKEVE